MAFQYQEIGQKLATNPQVAADMLVELLVRHGLNQSSAVRELGCDYRTLMRWLKRLQDDHERDVRVEVADKLHELKELAEKEGIEPPPEPPKAGRKKR